MFWMNENTDQFFIFWSHGTLECSWIQTDKLTSLGSKYRYIIHLYLFDFSNLKFFASIIGFSVYFSKSEKDWRQIDKTSLF